ncbi:DNA-binding response regulator [Streptomyces radicis]|uniref:DNA-binding response regulator n=1 Tax=Streptomyces radicis TaxID=1750517 RepID=A0A3A9WEU6_9ACTN|nr:response regulator transcription factor [Streptomyces radicis]RKN11535.1 DNA-binding response regulator [Streptomyces radicis]RKN26447.1 DNA-binding response regulator [Streptomyces radicis]
MIRIVVAEDEGLTREALVALIGLAEGLCVVASTGRGDEVLVLAEEHAADLVILDVEMPGMDGIQVVERLQALRAGFPTLMLTSHARPGSLQRALRAGARGFLTKEVSAERLWDVIRRVHGGDRYVDPGLAAAALAAGDNPLTAREAEVLRWAGEGNPLGVVADKLNVSEGTVRNHMSSAIRKLGAPNRIVAFHRATEAGWI